MWRHLETLKCFSEDFTFLHRVMSLRMCSLSEVEQSSGQRESLLKSFSLMNLKKFSLCMMQEMEMKALRSLGVASSCTRVESTSKIDNFQALRSDWRGTQQSVFFRLGHAEFRFDRMQIEVCWIFWCSRDWVVKIFKLSLPARLTLTFLQASNQSQHHFVSFFTQ